jgi:hypothetical protein
METVKSALKLVEAKRKVVDSLEAKEAAAIAKVKASYDEKFNTAQAELDKALEELDAAYSVIRHGAKETVETEAESA